MPTRSLVKSLVPAGLETKDRAGDCVADTYLVRSCLFSDELGHPEPVSRFPKTDGCAAANCGNATGVCRPVSARLHVLHFYIWSCLFICLFSSQGGVSIIVLMCVCVCIFVCRGACMNK